MRLERYAPLLMCGCGLSTQGGHGHVHEPAEVRQVLCAVGADHARPPLHARLVGILMGGGVHTHVV
jgi:hypothetical protein